MIENYHQYKLLANSNIHRNPTEKIKCLKTYECFHIYAETEPNAEPAFSLFFSVSAAKCQQIRQVILITPAHTQPQCIVYNLVIMEAIDGLSSETIV